MTKEREALRMALETLEKLTGPADLEHPYDALDLGDVAIVAIKEVLAQPEQEPVLWGVMSSDGKVSPYAHWSKKDAERIALHSHSGTVAAALYTAQPKRQPLTDEQIVAIIERLDPLFLDAPVGFELDFARAIEAAHNIGVEK